MYSGERDSDKGTGRMAASVLRQSAHDASEGLRTGIGSFGYGFWGFLRLHRSISQIAEADISERRARRQRRPVEAALHRARGRQSTKKLLHRVFDLFLFESLAEKAPKLSKAMGTGRTKGRR